MVFHLITFSIKFIVLILQYLMVQFPQLVSFFRLSGLKYAQCVYLSNCQENLNKTQGVKLRHYTQLFTRKQHVCVLYRTVAGQLSGQGSPCQVYWHCWLVLKHSSEGLIIEQSAAWDPWVFDGLNAVHLCFCINTSAPQSSAKSGGIISQIASQKHNVWLG